MKKERRKGERKGVDDGNVSREGSSKRGATDTICP